MRFFIVWVLLTHLSLVLNTSHVNKYLPGPSGQAGTAPLAERLPPRVQGEGGGTAVRTTTKRCLGRHFASGPNPPAGKSCLPGAPYAGFRPSPSLPCTEACLRCVRWKYDLFNLFDNLFFICLTYSFNYSGVNGVICQSEFKPNPSPDNELT